MTETAARNKTTGGGYLANKVPAITLMFWVLKLLTTGMGESMSDFMGDHSVPIAGLVGIGGMTLALRLQLRQRTYKAPYYWFVVMMVAIFGTMVADAIHDGASIGYPATTAAFGLFTAIVFWRWYRSEGTLSIHDINTPRRERFYWAAVFGTFALGTAAGDMTATSLNLGFSHSILLFGAVMLVPLLGWWRFKWNPIFAFWFAYIDTRPIGASFSDWFSKAHRISGLNFGDGHTSAVALVAFVALLTWTTLSGHGIQRRRGEARHRRTIEPHLGRALAPDPE
jgi:uncharacterized membrane-anchored protein